MHGNFWSSPSSSSRPLSRSCSSAGWTCTRRISPVVSTSRWRLRPRLFFPPVVPALAAGLGGLGALGVDDRCAGLPLAAELLLAEPFTQDGVDALQGPVLGPPVEGVAEGLPRPVLARDLPPLATGAFEIQQPVEDAAPRERGTPPSAVGLRQQRFQDGPLGVGQVARIMNWDLGGLHTGPPLR